MTARTRLPVLIAAFGALAVAGCTTTSAGTPAPGSAPVDETTSPSSEDLPSDGAPKVENPLDVSHFEQNPCDVLTPETAQKLNLPTTGEQDENSVVRGCYWNNRQTRGSLAVDFYHGDDRGLSSLYREAKGAGFAYFEPTADIEGHPAAAYHPKVAEPVVDCTVGVGLSDQLMFTVRVALSTANLQEKEPCVVAAEVAGLLMETMKEAA